MRKTIFALMILMLGFALVQGLLMADNNDDQETLSPPAGPIGPSEDVIAAPTIGPPGSMRDLVLHAGHREVQTMQIEKIEFRYIAPFSNLPLLIWPVEENKVQPFSRDLAEVSKWLRAHGNALGVNGFQTVFREITDWRGNEVWSFDLEREGLRLHRAHIDVHWRDGKLEGLFCSLPGPIHRFDRGGAANNTNLSDRVWFPVRRGTGWRDGSDAVLAIVNSQKAGPNIRTTYTHPSGELLSTVVSPAVTGAVPPPRTYNWTEYVVPDGTFPDQIDSDSQGNIWFSQPLDDQISIFDPVSETFDLVVTGDDDPDGLIVDRDDMVWSGLYRLNRGLGRVDAWTHDYTVFSPPYSNAQMAIPFQTCRGRVWVSDHMQNRVSEFDPSTQTWLGSYIMPTPACWVVDTTEDPRTENLYFTEYNVNQLGVMEPGGPIHEIAVSWGGPSFHVYSNGKVYYTLWTRSTLGAYEVSSGTNIEYDHPVANEYGGPVHLLSNGDVVVGSRNLGYVFIFRIATETFESYKIPTIYPGLKDGLRVDSNDVIWVTESFSNKIAKLEIDPITDLTMAVTGDCPGTVTITVSGATPGGQIAILFSPTTGSIRIPCGYDCGGRGLGLGSNMRFVTIAIADGNGEATVSGNAPAAACSGFLQAVDLQSCLTSGVEGLP
jgi:streptogramin lyase